MDKTGRRISPLVSTDWLNDHLKDSGLAILDIRSGDDYQAGHIPNAINVPCASWSTTRNDLFLELPEDGVLFNLIGSAGITVDSSVVVVHKTVDPPRPPFYPLADACRVADTLIYAGIANAAILDGGHDKWAGEKKALSTDLIVPLPVKYQGKTDKEMFVSREYVQERIGKSLILDVRDADVYFGVTIEPPAPRAGHIPGAKSLPTPWVWNADGTYKSPEVLREMASGILGEDVSGEIIIYCGVGGYASTWWFILTQMLGYRNVKFYDGSAQEWVRYHEMVKYKWE